VLRGTEFEEGAGSGFKATLQASRGDSRVARITRLVPSPHVAFLAQAFIPKIASDLQIEKVNGDTCCPRHNMQECFATTLE
jgi:hypothetical protein